MQAFRKLMIVGLLLAGWPLWSQESKPAESREPQGTAWTKTLEERSQRGTLHNAIQKVRGDTGKWNDDARLQLAPPIRRKPPNLSLDDWADQLQESADFLPVGEEETWLLFKTRQLDDNDRVWIGRMEREGNQFTIVLSEAVWQGRYSKTFTYYNVFGVNLGQLDPGKYTATWIVKPLEFREFEGSGRPTDQRQENWPKDDRPADEKPSKLSVKFEVPAEIR
jgi:hypothetical protein